MGNAYYDKKEYDEAIKCYEKALEINPEHNKAKNNFKEAQKKLKQKRKR
jgi:tetratricopeptide (TPR) repeat protein